METYVHLWQYRWILLRMRNVSDKSWRGNHNTHFVFSNFFLKSYRLWDNVEKYDSRTGHRRQYNTGHALCMLGNYGYKDTLRMCNTRLLFHCNNGCVNVPQCYVCTYIACFLSFIISVLCQYWGKCSVVPRNVELYKTGTLRDVLCGCLDWSSTVLCKCCTAMGGMLELLPAFSC